jgi:hypothetical protein
VADFLRIVRTAAVVLGCVGVAAATGAAQGRDDGPPPPLPARPIALAAGAVDVPDLQVADASARQQELERWVAEFTEWQAWAAQWGNRREPGWFSEFRKRREQPAPPAWLSDECAVSVDATPALAEACVLLAESRGTPRNPTKLVAATEQPEKTIWWEHLHLDVGWPAMQSGVSLLGVVGMHVTTTVHGRLEIFIAPGAMLMNVPTADGSRAWKLATNYGIAYRLGAFRVPGDRQALLHINLAKAWLLSSAPDVLSRSTDLVGFSMTFKKTR